MYPMARPNAAPAAPVPSKTKPMVADTSTMLSIATSRTCAAARPSEIAIVSIVSTRVWPKVATAMPSKGSARSGSP
jgi:hypothetical protein